MTQLGGASSTGSSTSLDSLRTDSSVEDQLHQMTKLVIVYCGTLSRFQHAFSVSALRFVVEPIHDHEV